MSAPAMMAYRVRGTTDDVTTCDNCGREELKSTVVMEVLDADGNTEDVIYAGCDCAAKLAKRTQKEIKADARRADKERAEKIERVANEANWITTRARDTALAAWVTATYGVPAHTLGLLWPHAGDVPGMTPFRTVKAWEAAGKPGLDPALDVPASVWTAKENARYLPDGVDLADATPQQVIDAIRAGRAPA